MSKRKKPSLTGLAALGALALPAINIGMAKDVAMNRKIAGIIEMYTGAGQGYAIPQGKFDLSKPLITYGSAAVPVLAKKLINGITGNALSRSASSLPVGV